MATLDFGVRPVRRINYNRVVSLPKDWLRDKGIEDRGSIACRMNEAGDLVLSAIPDREGKIRYRDLGRAELGGTPAPGPTIAVTRGAS